MKRFLLFSFALVGGYCVFLEFQKRTQHLAHWHEVPDPS